MCQGTLIIRKILEKKTQISKLKKKHKKSVLENFQIFLLFENILYRDPCWSYCFLKTLFLCVKR
jgi:hypothetical protein